MAMFTKPERLTDAELDRLGDFLKSCKGGSAMNVEALDGFFAALIAGAETVMPSEYYREVFGGEMSDACEFSSLEEENEILGLMMRHWNTIAGTLFNGEVYVPLLLEDGNGVAHDNDWAHGFMRCMHMRHNGWAELVNHRPAGRKPMRRRASVFALRGSEHNNAVSPSGGGFDIACGNKAVPLDIPAAEVGATRARSVWRWPKTILRTVFLLSWTHWQDCYAR